MARPGLEPGTPRFSGSRPVACLHTKGLQIPLSRAVMPRRDPVTFGRFGARLGLRGGVEVPASRGAPRQPGEVDLRCARLSGPRPDPRVTPVAGSRRHGSATALPGRGQRVLRRRCVEARYRWARVGQQRGRSAERGSGWPNRGPRETRPRSAPRVVGVIMPAGAAPDSVTASHRPLPARRR